jgi:hypothetical protein
VFAFFVVLVPLYFLCCWLLMYVGWFGFMVLLWWVVFFTLVNVVWSLLGYCIFVLFAFIK